MYRKDFGTGLYVRMYENVHYYENYYKSHRISYIIHKPHHNTNEDVRALWLKCASDVETSHFF